MRLYHIVQQLILFDYKQWKKKTHPRFLNLGFNIKANILCVFHLSNFFKERKLYVTPHTFFLLLEEPNKLIQNVTSKLFSIRVWKNGAFFDFTINFKLMEMVEWRASFNNQCPLYWFRLQIITIGERQSTTIWQICHVKGGGTWLSS
jgi:hypothetical protein